MDDFDINKIIVSNKVFVKMVVNALLVTKMMKKLYHYVLCFNKGVGTHKNLDQVK